MVRLAWHGRCIGPVKETKRPVMTGEDMKSSVSKLAALVLTLSALAACTATPTQKTAGEQIDDSVLTGKVKAALVQDPATKARQIDVETFRGTVQLNGFVDSAEAKAAATRVARSVEGVKSVDNNLDVGGTARTAGEVVDDGLVTTKVKAALVAEPATKAHEINVETREGVVQLSGFVDSADEKSKAAEVAGRVAGVKEVHNDLRVKSL
jgi:hyperosmotically inducible periplasmic protein